MSKIIIKRAIFNSIALVLLIASGIGACLYYFPNKDEPLPDYVGTDSVGQPIANENVSPARPEQFKQITVSKEDFDHQNSGNSKPTLTVRVPLSSEFGIEKEYTDLGTLEDALEEPLLFSKSGKWVGHETGAGERTIFYEGDVDKMFAALEPLLQKTKWRDASCLDLDYHDENKENIRLALPLTAK